MPEKVSQSLVIDFEQGGSANGSNGGELLLEYDTRPESEGGLNPRSQPLFTDNAFFLLYAFKASNISVSSSSGTATINTNSVTETRTETISFDEETEARLRRPAANIVSVDWIGQSGGTVTSSGSTVSIPNGGNYVANIVYETQYNVITLTPPTLDANAVSEYTINIVVTADEDL